MKRRSNMAPQRYTPSAKEPLAVDPQAFLELFIVPSSRESELVGDTCIVDVCGPLDQYDTGWGDSYEAIKARFVEACASTSKAIVMRIDSPGGAVSGCFDTVRAIRAMCVKAGKPLYAYCDHACSAGYAIAAAATHGVVMSDTGTVGSIGCVQTRRDQSAQNAQGGVRYEFVASGARKLDGNVDAAITDDEIAATRTRVDYVAGLFFGLIEDTRGIGAARVQAMQAGVFHAEAALNERLVDGVMSFESLLATVASGGTLAMTAFEKARDALEEAAKGDDANAAVAKKALAAMTIAGDDEPDDKPDDEDKPEGEGDDDDTHAEGDDDKPDAASDDAPADDKPAKKPAAAAGGAGAEATTHSIALEALERSHRLEAQMATDKDAAQRKALVKSRPDFDKALRGELMKASTPIGTVRRLVKELPRKPVPKPEVAASSSTASGTRGTTQGASQGAGAGGSAPDDPRGKELSAMDAQMGLTKQTLGTYRKGNALLFGVVNQPDVAAAPPSGGKAVSK